MKELVIDLSMVKIKEFWAGWLAGWLAGWVTGWLAVVVVVSAFQNLAEIDGPEMLIFH
jgi:hypothetical protein